MNTSKLFSAGRLPDNDRVTEIWQKYRRGVEHHANMDLYENTARAYRFYEGAQWQGIDNSAELPVMNFIAPTVEYKTAMVAKQQIRMVYTPERTAEFPESAKLCEDLNAFAAQHWEAQKMDALCWQVIRDACIAGDSYLYFYNRNLEATVLDNTAVYLGDEQQPDIQKQPYIIFYERRPVAEIRREAEKNGLKKEQIEQILPDSDYETSVGDIHEVKGEQTGKCACLLYMEKGADGAVHIARSTRTVIYQPDTVITGMTRYPVASLVWTRRKNSARGIGEVTPLVPNQIEANRLLARRLISAKLNAFAKPVYVKNLVENPADVDAVGKAIEIKNGTVNSVRDIFSYVAPAPMSTEASTLQNELITLTRELAGAGNAALGEVNPENASGAAIIAVQDQAAIPLNKQTAAFKQFVEDVALVWFDIWRAYHPDGLVVETEEEPGLFRRDIISREALDTVAMRVRIDASPTNPFSMYAREQALENAKTNGDITFEEYVEALSADATAPKEAFTQILNRRGASAQALLPEREPVSPLTAGLI